MGAEDAKIVRDVGALGDADVSSRSHDTERRSGRGANKSLCVQIGECAGKPEVDSKLILRPKATNLAEGNRAQLIKQGQALFNDTKLSTNGMSCMNCHADNANFAASFTTPYPHRMAMAAEKSGVEQVRLDEAIQFCMIVPMQAKPLSWSSRELSALTAYMGELQTAVRKETAGATGSKSANPCAPKAANPCAPKK